MATLMPRDDDHAPIPALRLRPGGAHTLAVGAASTRTATAFAAATRVIGLYATVPVHLQTGDDAVTASAADHYFPAGTYYDLSLGGDGRARDTHLAAIQADGPGTLYISEKQ
jgi:hypothetical protein